MSQKYLLVKSPIEGIVSRVFVGEGEKVEKGKSLFSLSIMKTENLVPSPRTCLVKSVKVKEGHRVRQNETLAIVELIFEQEESLEEKGRRRVTTVASHVLENSEWLNAVEEMKERKRLASLHGGEERARIQRENGKLLVRERIAKLVDEDSFLEVGSFAGFAKYDDNNSMESFLPANCVGGIARIGREVVVVGDDFSNRAGYFV